jgi:Xaa-Pro aminopeptidase
MDKSSWSERDRRWAAAAKTMARNDLDVILTYSDFGDQSTLQRYLSNYRSSYDYMAALLYKSKDMELILTHPGGIQLAKQLSWATEAFPMAVPAGIAGHNSATRPSLSGQIANRFAERGVKRVGVAGMEYFPAGWVAMLQAAIPGIELVDIWADLHHQRLVKSPYEQALVREACRISDDVWDQMADIFRVGRKRYEALADMEHIIRAQGCEDSFNLCMALPMLKEPIDRNPYSALRIKEDTVYMVEVSPRYLGYYGQQTNLVATGAIPNEMRAAHDAANRARDKAMAVAKPGVDLTELGAVIAAQLRADGFESATPSFGHAVGLELEDQHINGSSLVLEAGMTFIFHPLLAGHPAVMRADTYLITESGAERLTKGDPSPLQL